MDAERIATTIHGLTDDELREESTYIIQSLLNIGVDPNVVCELLAIKTEQTIRSMCNYVRNGA